MDKYKETFNTWNNVAALYQDKFMNLDLYNETYDYICNFIKNKKAKLLDVGCGPGNITKYLLSKKSDFDIFGIDISPKMIELAKINNPLANFEVMDGRFIKNLKTKYDGIIVGFCLPYLSQIECNELISNSYNLLKENGLIYLSFIEGDPNKSDFKISSGGRVFFNYHNLNSIKEKLITKKFNNTEVFKVEYKRSETEIETHTIVIAKK